jgi:hypothetical protein
VPEYRVVHCVVVTWASGRNDFCDEAIVATFSAAQQLKFPVSVAEDFLY